mmetsp:Transcript_33736/g.84580  ORF Transcript_33736/g.84580 Transcript_33736/m.84580 type:complete len:341 (-) Transcript_33736:38-1060(-)
MHAVKAAHRAPPGAGLCLGAAGRSSSRSSMSLSSPVLALSASSRLSSDSLTQPSERPATPPAVRPGGWGPASPWSFASRTSSMACASSCCTAALSSTPPPAGRRSPGAVAGGRGDGRAGPRRSSEVVPAWLLYSPWASSACISESAAASCSCAISSLTSPLESLPPSSTPPAPAIHSAAASPTPAGGSSRRVAPGRPARRRSAVSATRAKCAAAASGLAGGGGGGGVLLAGRGVTSGSATSGGQAAGLLGGGGELLEAEHQRVAHAQHVLQLLHAALELGDALAGVVEGHVLVVHGRTHLLRTLRVERDEVGAQHGDALLLERAKVGAREDVHVEEVHLR